jgi:glycosyltransferase involved in cell wall biosynthesis
VVAPSPNSGKIEMQNVSQTNKTMEEGQIRPSSLPLLSIIVPTYNMGQYLERCLLSLFREIDSYYPNAEVIVIDGGSKDGSIELLKKYNRKIAYWVSEPDSVSEAVNKGLAKARGEIVYLIGADDELLPGSALYMVRYLEEHPDVDAVFAEGEYFKESAQGDLERISVSSFPPGGLTLNNFLRLHELGWPSPELQFTRKRVFDRFGGYDFPFRYWCCLEMWCRHAKNGVVFQQISRIIARRYYTPKSGNSNLDMKEYWKSYYTILWRYGGLYWLLRSHFGPEARIKDVIMAPVHVACRWLGVRPRARIRVFMQSLRDRYRKGWRSFRAPR